MIMKKIKLNVANDITLKNIVGFVVKKVTKFGSGAKVDCPKEFLGKTVYLVILED